MERFKIIAFTHKNLGIDDLGKLHIPETELLVRLSHANADIGVDELMYISTCNRVEFLVSSRELFDKKFLLNFFAEFYPTWDQTQMDWAIKNVSVFEGEKALLHLYAVASSIDSLVVGEREIITQVRNAYENCKNLGFTGDLLRIVIQKTIENAKEVYTQTDISRKPVSVVSLAYRRLRELNVKLDAKILIIGAGVTNTAMCRYLKKHGFKNFTVFNRSITNADKLAAELSAEAFPLSELNNFKKGFDVMVTCTGSVDAVITKDLYNSLIGNDKSKKIVIDLAVPNDVAADVLNSYDINLIAVNNLQEVANENLKEREKELVACEMIIVKNIEEFKYTLRERKVELAMSQVPKMVKEIRETAVNEIFAKDIDGMDSNSKEVLEKVLSYMEKKYISVPMKMAKDIMIDEDPSK